MVMSHPMGLSQFLIDQTQDVKRDPVQTGRRYRMLISKIQKLSKSKFKTQHSKFRLEEDTECWAHKLSKSKKSCVKRDTSLLFFNCRPLELCAKMVGVWAMCLWEQMGQPNGVNLIELGPGRGTLMADLLRGSSKCKNFIGSLHIHMVECSPTLQKLQYENLNCVDEDHPEKRSISTLARTPVSWHATLEQVPTGLPTIIIAHEFFDALPVHQFQELDEMKKLLKESGVVH
ncbi:hypothetical protein LOK49_LG02G00832 [Camellia lanceoleosa]|uniref:Uncharacterized protein n=1 Tax=Camellia lanceoleosa TaxID=1840588 RepID=A0ACC0IIC7_9ERIC|nr:hypothetical protein LOK49_LG02G00832 [Camellia lanceoleosa]